MNTGDKILGKHIRQFLHKNNVQLGSLTIQSNKTALQLCKTTAKKDKKRAARANLFFFLLIRKKGVLHVQFFFFLLIRSIDLDSIFIAVPVQLYTINFFFVYKHYQPELRFQPWLNPYIVNIDVQSLFIHFLF